MPQVTTSKWGTLIQCKCGVAIKVPIGVVINYTLCPNPKCKEVWNLSPKVRKNTKNMNGKIYIEEDRIGE